MLHLITLAAALVSSVQSIPLNSTLDDSMLHVNVSKRGDIHAYDYLQGFLKLKMHEIMRREPHYHPTYVNADLNDKISKNVQCVLGISDVAGVVTNSRIGTKGELEAVYSQFARGAFMDHQYHGEHFHDKWLEGQASVTAKFQNVFQMSRKDGTRMAGHFLKQHTVKAALKSMRYVSSQSESTLDLFYQVGRLFGAFVPLPFSTYDAIEAIRDTFNREGVSDGHSNHFKSTHRDRIVVCATYQDKINYNTPVKLPKQFYGSVHEDGVIDYLHMHFAVNDIVTDKNVNRRDPWLRDNWPGPRF